MIVVTMTPNTGILVFAFVCSNCFGM